MACPMWESSVKSMMNDDELTTAFMQATLGSSLVGYVQDKFATLMNGDGNNGKSVVSHVHAAICGDDFVKVLSKDVLMRPPRGRSSGAAQPHLMDLKGLRFGYIAESDSRDTLDEAQVKQLTGGDNIRARGLFRDNQTISATHKLALLTQYLPEVAGHDKALWNRLCVIPFPVQFVPKPTSANERECVVNLKDRIVADEASGVLAWLVRGCRRWLAQKGAGEWPPAVRAASDQYKQEACVLQRFLDECCDKVEASRFVTLTALYEVFCTWADASNALKWEKSRFDKQMRHLQAKNKSRNNQGITYTGLAIKSERVSVNAGAGEEEEV